MTITITITFTNTVTTSITVYITITVAIAATISNTITTIEQLLLPPYHGSYTFPIRSIARNVIFTIPISTVASYNTLTIYITLWLLLQY